MRRYSILGFMFGFFYNLFPWLSLSSLFSVVENNGGGAGAGGADPTGATGTAGDTKTGAGAGQGGTPGAAAVDVQGEIQKALAAQQAAFNKQFKDATGHDSLAAFQESEAKRKGETDKLLEQRNAELANANKQLEQVTVQTALLGAAANAVDPDAVLALLSGKAKVENGVVTVGGNPPAEAVAALLKDKPYLAKPSGGQGSGAGAGGAGAVKNPWAKDTLNLTEQGRISRENPALAESLKAQAA